jgi:hypothetical protein
MARPIIAAGTGRAPFCYYARVMAETHSLQVRLPRRGGPAGTPCPPCTAARIACAAMLATVVLLGGLELHPADESHDPLGSLAGRQGDTFFQGASHPVQPPHAETAREARRPVCALCLNRLQSLGARLDRAARLSTLTASRRLPFAVATAPLLRSLHPDGARAPPAA